MDNIGPCIGLPPAPPPLAADIKGDFMALPMPPLAAAAELNDAAKGPLPPDPPPLPPPVIMPPPPPPIIIPPPTPPPPAIMPPDPPDLSRIERH